jgi:hypothetical protein
LVLLVPGLQWCFERQRAHYKQAPSYTYICKDENEINFGWKNVNRKFKTLNLFSHIHMYID